MKRITAFLLSFLLCLSVSIPALSIDNPAFSVNISGTLDASQTFNGLSTLVLDWRIMANRDGLTLRNTQGLRLAYDNTVLQLMKWDISDVIADSGTGTTFGVIPEAGRVGVYTNAVRVSAAKSVSGNLGYLNIALGNAYETYNCPQGSFVTLAQVRLAFRSGKSTADLTENSIRCMTVSELAATAQSSAILMNNTENEITSYEYLRQVAGVAVGGDKLNAPTADYPHGSTGNDDPPKDPPGPSQTGTPPDTEPPDATDPVAPGDPPDYNNPYTDVALDDWFYEAVRYATEQGLVNGVGNNKFSPNTPTTRAMFATVLYRLAGQPGVTGQSIFTDVEDGQWYSDAIQWANENGIIFGYGGGRFGPDDIITREQAVTLLYRYSEKIDRNTSDQADLSKYTDAFQILDWALSAMRWAVGAGIVYGRSPTTLVPQGQMTRAEVVGILQNYG